MSSEEDAVAEEREAGAAVHLALDQLGLVVDSFGAAAASVPIQYLEARHRAHARIEDHIRCAKTTGIGRFPSRHFTINQTWLELSLTALDLLAWTRTLLLDGESATAEPKKLRYQLLHTAARITRGGRRLHLRIAATWPWRHELISAFTRLTALPRPAT